MKNNVIKKVMVSIIAGITACIAFSGCTASSDLKEPDYDHHMVVFSVLNQELDGTWVREDGSQKFVIDGCKYKLIDSEDNTIENGIASSASNESGSFLYYQLTSSDNENTYDVDYQVSEDNRSILKMRDESGDIYIFE